MVVVQGLPPPTRRVDPVETLVVNSPHLGSAVRPDSLLYAEPPRKQEAVQSHILKRLQLRHSPLRRVGSHGFKKLVQVRVVVQHAQEGRVARSEGRTQSVLPQLRGTLLGSTEAGEGELPDHRRPPPE
eukprot:4086866-Alexandrium_andersonii.AAC.1